MDKIWLKEVRDEEEFSVYYFEINGKKFTIDAPDDDILMAVFLETDPLYNLIEGDMWHLEWSIEMFRVREDCIEYGEEFDLEEESQLYLDEVEDRKQREKEIRAFFGYEDVQDEKEYILQNIEIVEPPEYQEERQEKENLEDLCSIEICCNVYEEEENQEDEKDVKEKILEAHYAPVERADFIEMIDKIVIDALPPRSVPESIYGESIVVTDTEEVEEDVFMDYFDLDEKDIVIMERRKEIHVPDNKMSVGRFFRYLLQKFGKKRYNRTVFCMMYSFVSSVNYNGTLRRFLYEGRSLYGYSPEHFKIGEIFRQWVTFYWISFLNRSDSEWGSVEKNLLMNVWKNLHEYYDSGQRYMYKFDVNYKEFDLSSVKNKILTGNVRRFPPFDEDEKYFLSSNIQLIFLKFENEVNKLVVEEFFDMKYYRDFFLTNEARKRLGLRGIDSWWIYEFLNENYIWMYPTRGDEYGYDCLCFLDCFLPNDVLLNEN